MTRRDRQELAVAVLGAALLFGLPALLSCGRLQGWW